LDGDTLWLAFALVLIIEGLLPFISPQGWRKLFLQLLNMQDGQIRFFALCSILSGLLLIWLAS
jgi:hypothetical protein